MLEKKPFHERRPPSEIIKSELKSKGNQLLEESSCQNVAKQVLLKPAEVTFWVEKKAAQTRKQKNLHKQKKKQKNAEVGQCVVNC